MPGAFAGAADLPHCELELAGIDLEEAVFGGGALAVRHGVRDDGGHVQAALQGGDGGVLFRDGADTGHELAEAGHDDAGLAEGRQHAFDVVHEGRRRAHQQHAGGLQSLPVGVEQVGGAVQRDGGLAGSGTALDHQRAGHGGTDDAVLFGLDGSDDVRHASGALGIQGREQRAFPLHGFAAVQHGGVQDVVLDGLHFAALQDQVPAAADALAVEGGGLVEVAGFGSAPVDHEPLQVRRGQADASDVLRLARVEVEAAEDEAFVDGVELGQAVLVQCREGIAFRDVLHGAHRAGAANLRQLAPFLFAQFVQPRVEPGHVLAFVEQISVVHQNVPLSEMTDRPFYSAFAQRG